MLFEATLDSLGQKAQNRQQICGLIEDQENTHYSINIAVNLSKSYRENTLCDIGGTHLNYKTHCLLSETMIVLLGKKNKVEVGFDCLLWPLCKYPNYLNL